VLRPALDGAREPHPPRPRAEDRRRGAGLRGFRHRHADPIRRDTAARAGGAAGRARAARVPLKAATAPVSGARAVSVGQVNDAGGPEDEIAALRRDKLRADERVAAVSDVIQTIARTTFDLDAVLQTVVDRAVELCRADMGNVARREGDTYRVVAFTSFTPLF